MPGMPFREPLLCATTEGALHDVPLSVVSCQTMFCSRRPAGKSAGLQVSGWPAARKVKERPAVSVVLRPHALPALRLPRTGLRLQLLGVGHCDRVLLWQWKDKGLPHSDLAGAEGFDHGPGAPAV